MWLIHQLTKCFGIKIPVEFLYFKRRQNRISKNPIELIEEQQSRSYKSSSFPFSKSDDLDKQKM